MASIMIVSLCLVFQQAGVNLDKPMVATCGSGMTACWVIIAALLCGVKTVPLYDVSSIMAYTISIAQLLTSTISYRRLGIFHW